MEASFRHLWPVGIPGDPSEDEWPDMEIFQWPAIDSSKLPFQVEKNNSLFSLFREWCLPIPECQSDEDWLDLVMAQCLIDSAKEDLLNNSAKEILLGKSAKKDLLDNLAKEGLLEVRN